MEETRFGKLVRLSARQGWAGEAREFTPWLAENLDELGKELGLALELRETEHKVGRYSLDMLLKDADGRVVIVENQFEQTNHDHLGKLLTYCAGTQAQVVIWIAESINDEHAAALTWLNQNTDEDIAFFGVELELCRLAARARWLRISGWSYGPTSGPSKRIERRRARQNGVGKPMSVNYG